MPQFDSEVVAWMFYILLSIAGLVLLGIGMVIGRAIGRSNIGATVASRERELFMAQKGFRQLYESEIEQLKTKNSAHEIRIEELTKRAEEYRKKAAGFGGLFGAHHRRADAMYALLLENEALEEQLLQKNQKLKNERDEATTEALRAASYRRILMSHILADARVKKAVEDVVADDKRLPDTRNNA